MRYATFLVAAGLLLAAPGAVQAQGLAGKAAREFGELLTKKLGRKAAGEAAERATGRIARGAASYGDDAAKLLGRHGDDAAKLLGRHADDIAGLGIRNTDDAARLLTRSFASLGGEAGESAAKAAGRIGARNGRRLAMMAESSELKAIGRTPELMGVIQRYGDPAMEFVWRHKGSLAVGTTLAAFLANPEKFIDGTKDITSTVAEHAVKPAIVAAGDVSRSAVDTAGWMLLILAGGTAAALYAAARNGALAKAGLEAAAGLLKRK